MAAWGMYAHRMLGFAAIAETAPAAAIEEARVSMAAARGRAGPPQ
jgi:hypothetical protein